MPAFLLIVSFHYTELRLVLLSLTMSGKMDSGDSNVPNYSDAMQLGFSSIVSGRSPLRRDVTGYFLVG